MAAGKALVGGTAYDITAGKTLIGGTAYDITAGKTLVGGTAHDIAFVHTLPSLEDVLKDMTLLVYNGNNIDGSINAATYGFVYTGYWPKSVTDVYPHYIIAMCDGNTAIIKAENVDSLYYIKYNWNNYNVSIKRNTYESINYRYVECEYNTQTQVLTADQVYGASVIAVQFPHYSDTDVDAVLGGMTITKVAGRDSSSRGYVRTNTDKGHQFYITTKYKTNGTSYTGSDPGNTGFVIWSCDGTTWTKLNQVTPNWQAGNVSSGYLTLGSCYGGSIVALDAA